MYAIDNMFTMYYGEIIFTGFWCKYDAEHLTTASHSHRHTLHLITAMVFRQSGVSVDNRCRAQPLSSLQPVLLQLQCLATDRRPELWRLVGEPAQRTRTHPPPAPRRPARAPTFRTDARDICHSKSYFIAPAPQTNIANMKSVTIKRCGHLFSLMLSLVAVLLKLFPAFPILTNV